MNQTPPDKDFVFAFFEGRYHVFYKKFLNLKGKTGGVIKVPSPFRSETKPSFQIHLSGEFAGRWHDFGTGEDGDLFDFYKQTYGLNDNFSEILTRVCSEFGINTNTSPPKKRNNLQQIAKSKKRQPKTYDASWTLPFTDALLRNQGSSLDYLYGRGIEDKTIANFLLGYSTTTIDEKEYSCIIIPHLSIDGEKVVLVKKRTFPEKNYLREAGMASCLFNERYIANAKDDSVIYICEGEFDAMILWQCGFKTVISGTTGAGSFQTDWVKKLERFTTIVIAYDADAAGNEGSVDLTKRLGEDRVRVVRLPENINDINNAYLEIGKEATIRIINNAQAIPIPNVVSFLDAGETLLSRLLSGDILEEGYPWPWDIMTNKVGRIVPGRMIEVSGMPGMGKSTMAIQVATYLAGFEATPSLVCCLEMTPTDLIKFVIQSIAGLTEEELTPDKIELYLDQCGDWPLFFQFHDEFVTIDNVLSTLTDAYKRFGIKFCVIDNLHLLARAAYDELKEQGKISRMLKLWAVRHDVAVMLIVHPRKTQEGHLETLYDIRGNAAVTADADTALAMWRQNLQPRTEEDLINPNETPLFHPVTCFLQNKGRFKSGLGKVWLYNEGQYRRFRKLTNDDEFPVIKITLPNGRNVKKFSI